MKLTLVILTGFLAVLGTAVYRRVMLPDPQKVCEHAVYVSSLTRSGRVGVPQDIRDGLTAACVFKVSNDRDTAIAQGTQQVYRRVYGCMLKARNEYEVGFCGGLF